MTSLRQRMLEDMQVRNLSPHTQASYVQQVSRFARHFGRSPDTLGPEEIRACQLYLTNDRKLAPGSICIAVSALRFLYTVTLKTVWPVGAVIPAPKQPQTLPVVLSPECQRSPERASYDQRRVMTSDRQASAVAPGVVGIDATVSLT